jgi:hypothetical protein
VFQCGDNDLYTLTLYRSGDNLPVDACGVGWRSRAGLLMTNEPGDAAH